MQVALQQLNSGCAWEARRGWRGPLHTRGDVCGRAGLPPPPCCSSHEQIFIPKGLCAVTQTLPKVLEELSRLVPLRGTHSSMLAERAEEKSIWLVTQENVKVRCKEEECNGIVCPCPSIPHSCKGDSLDLQMAFL